MAFREIKVQEEVAANLVPMIDIMFLLLLFFMLNADMSQRELEDLVTPTANKSDEDKPDDNTDRITLNVFHSFPDCAYYTDSVKNPCPDQTHWQISLGGQHYQLNKPGLDELQKKLTALGDTKRPVIGDPKSVSERHILVRADRVAPYGFIQRGLERTAGAGLYKVEVAAQKEKSSVNSN